MKKKQKQPARKHQSTVLNDFLSLGTKEEHASVEARMVLAAKMEDALEAKGLTKKQFAEMLGQRPSVITKWLSGGHNFTVDTLVSIQQALNIKLLDLELGKPEKKARYEVRVAESVSSPVRVPSAYSIYQYEFNQPPIGLSAQKDQLRRSSPYA